MVTIIPPSAIVQADVKSNIIKINYPHMLLCMWVFLCLKNKTIELVQIIILASLENLRSEGKTSEEFEVMLNNLSLRRTYFSKIRISIKNHEG